MEDKKREIKIAILVGLFVTVIGGLIHTFLIRGIDSYTVFNNGAIGDTKENTLKDDDKFVVNTKPQKVQLPPLSKSGYIYSKYSELLKKDQIHTVVKDTVYDPKLAEGWILYLFVRGETKSEKDLNLGNIWVERGETLEFVITKRLSNEFEIPDLVCRSFMEAEFIVSNLNLNVGDIIEDASVTDRNTAYVFKQIPKPEEQKTIKIGSQIKIWLTQKKPIGCDN